MKKRYITLFAATLLCCSAVEAETLTWSQATEAILSNNLTLKELEVSNRAKSTAARDEASSLELTEVEFEHLWAQAGDNKWNLGVTQTFDWPGAYGKKRRAADAWSRAYDELYNATANNLRLQARSAFESVTYCNLRLELLDSMLKNMQKLEEYIRTGFDQGQLTILDVKKIQLEVYGLKAQIADVEQERTALLADIVSLASGKELDIDFSAYGMQPFHDRAYYEQVASESPEILAVRAQAQANLAEAGAASASRLPGISLGYRHAFEENTHFNGLSVGVALPFFSRRQASKAARLEAEALKLQASDVNATAQAEIGMLYENAARRREQFNGLREVTLENNYPDLLMMAYKGGQINIITYIQEANYFLEARKDYLAAEFEMQSALTRLNRYNPVPDTAL